MDIESRLEELAQAYAAGRLSEVELTRLQQEALRIVAADTTPAAPGIDGGWPVGENLSEGALSAGQVIGPLERRMRLVQDLSGRGRLWLAHPADGGAGAEAFRAIKIFLPAGYQPGWAAAERDERASRADLINLRSYLAKVRARVELSMKLDHPGIVRIYGWRQGADGWPFAEMEYLSPQHGQTLAQWLNTHCGDCAPWEQIERWLRPVAAALDWARREHRLAHQHLDADTVFITDQGAVRLLGFGLATEIREPRSVLFSTGVANREAGGEGAAETVAVETTYRRDVFALALLAYRLLAGRSVQEAQAEPPGAVPRPAGLTDEAWQVLRRGLAYPSELCPTDAGQFIQALDAAQQPAQPPARQRPWLKPLLGALAVGAILALGLRLYWGGAPVTEESPTAAGQSVEAPPPETPATAVLEAPIDEGTTLRDAEREVDQRAFEAARRVDTVAAYRLYLQRCPQCGYGRDARAAIKNLETRQKIEALKADFAALIVAFEEGREERGDQALARLETLTGLAPDDPLIASGRQRLAQGWVKLALTSLNKPDPEQARKWLKKVEAIQPDWPQLAALHQALKQAETAEQAKQTDAEAFAAARRVDTRKAYWAYLDQCAPDCRHRAEAETGLARLAPAYPVLRDRLSDNTLGPEMVALPAGEFQMGSPPAESGRYNDEPIRTVRIAKPFAIGKYEVMFHEYDRFATAANRPLPADQGWGRGRRPVINVNWKNAVAYADWLSQQTGQRYRLPTEAEWEYAARAGTKTSRYWGDDPNQGCAYANAADLDGKQVYVGWPVMQCRDGQVHTAPVGGYRDNDFGLHDMAGNVLEWTCSVYDKESKAPVQECQEPGGDQEMVVRGGSWSDEPQNVRSADRHRSRPDFQDYFLGFRLVREQP